MQLQLAEVLVEQFITDAQGGTAPTRLGVTPLLLKLQLAPPSLAIHWELATFLAVFELDSRSSPRPAGQLQQQSPADRRYRSFAA